ncbi:unnamed protein product [Amoebophrya sp. A120]|nr:unnamed protein product [Amoebophrya sp. A120]|eukprot:GSA120T00010378001.1
MRGISSLSTTEHKPPDKSGCGPAGRGYSMVRRSTANIRLTRPLQNNPCNMTTRRNYMMVCIAFLFLAMLDFTSFPTLVHARRHMLRSEKRLAVERAAAARGEQVAAEDGNASTMSGASAAHPAGAGKPSSSWSGWLDPTSWFPLSVFFGGGEQEQMTSDVASSSTQRTHQRQTTRNTTGVLQEKTADVDVAGVLQPAFSFLEVGSTTSASTTGEMISVDASKKAQQESPVRGKEGGEQEGAAPDANTVPSSRPAALGNTRDTSDALDATNSARRLSTAVLSKEKNNNALDLPSLRLSSPPSSALDAIANDVADTTESEITSSRIDQAHRNQADQETRGKKRIDGAAASSLNERPDATSTTSTSSTGSRLDASDVEEVDERPVAIGAGKQLQKNAEKPDKRRDPAFASRASMHEAEEVQKVNTMSASTDAAGSSKNLDTAPTLADAGPAPETRARSTFSALNEGEHSQQSSGKQQTASTSARTSEEVLVADAKGHKVKDRSGKFSQLLDGVVVPAQAQSSLPDTSAGSHENRAISSSQKNKAGARAGSKQKFSTDVGPDHAGSSGAETSPLHPRQIDKLPSTFSPSQQERKATVKDALAGHEAVKEKNTKRKSKKKVVAEADDATLVEEGQEVKAPTPTTGAAKRVEIEENEAAEASLSLLPVSPVPPVAVGDGDYSALEMNGKKSQGFFAGFKRGMNEMKFADAPWRNPDLPLHDFFLRPWTRVKTASTRPENGESRQMAYARGRVEYAMRYAIWTVIQMDHRKAEFLESDDGKKFAKKMRARAREKKRKRQQKEAAEKKAREEEKEAAGTGADQPTAGEKGEDHGEGREQNLAKEEKTMAKEEGPMAGNGGHQQHEHHQHVAAEEEEKSAGKEHNETPPQNPGPKEDEHDQAVDSEEQAAAALLENDWDDWVEDDLGAVLNLSAKQTNKASEPLLSLTEIGQDFVTVAFLNADEGLDTSAKHVVETEAELRRAVFSYLGQVRARYSKATSQRAILLDDIYVAMTKAIGQVANLEDSEAERLTQIDGLPEKMRGMYWPLAKNTRLHESVGRSVAEILKSVPDSVVSPDTDTYPTGDFLPHIYQGDRYTPGDRTKNEDGGTDGGESALKRSDSVSSVPSGKHENETGRDD